MEVYGQQQQFNNISNTNNMNNKINIPSNNNNMHFNSFDPLLHQPPRYDIQGRQVSYNEYKNYYL